MSEWKEYKLGDVAERITSGGTPSTKISEYYSGNISWLNTKEINFNRIFNTETRITELGLKCSSAKWIKENYSVDYVDTITEPGVDKTITENSVFESIKTKEL